ncbi:MAG: hypothetical protein AAFZ18_26760 [Myxococcota bacterium]
MSVQDTLLEPADLVQRMMHAEDEALRADFDAAHGAARLLRRAADRTQAAAHRRIQAHGPVPLAAAASPRFPLLWILPALDVGRAFGDDVTAWLIAWEDRTFLRLVNLPEGGPARLRDLPFGDGPVHGEIRVRPELPFALDELAEDCVYELSGRPVTAQALASPNAAPARPGQRESWEELLSAYADADSAQPRARKEQLAGALERLLFTPSGEPRPLRPWALLSLQGLAAEIQRASPRGARDFGLARLRAHPQCFASLARRLPRDRDGR